MNFSNPGQASQAFGKVYSNALSNGKLSTHFQKSPGITDLIQHVFRESHQQSTKDVKTSRDKMEELNKTKDSLRQEMTDLRE